MTAAVGEPVPTRPPTGVRRARRLVVVGLVALQLGMVVRAYWAPHMEFGFQMFPEASQWQADVVRVTADGRRVSIEEPWFGYEWNDLVQGRGLGTPWRRKHADAGLDNQLEFLAEALDWVAANTPRDDETVRLEAKVTLWHNMGDPRRVVLTSDDRSRP